MRTLSDSTTARQVREEYSTLLDGPFLGRERNRSRRSRRRSRDGDYQELQYSSTC